MEETLIVFIVFGCVVAIVKLALDYSRDKHAMRASSGASSSLTSTELKAIVQDAVDDAFEVQFGRLERRLDEMQEHRLMPANIEHPDISQAKPESPPVQRDRERLL